MIESAFRIEKSDLRIRPIWHQKKERVAAHILVCFLAYVLWKTLAQMCKAAGLGSEPRKVIDEFGGIKMVDVVMTPCGLAMGSPTTSLTSPTRLWHGFECSPIQSAFEFAGYKLPRGCGCRGGFCGACATVFRVAGDYWLKVGLACQTVVQPEMSVSTVPFSPAQKALYDMSRVSDPARTALDLYPELTRCHGCAPCNKACPQNLDVLGYVAAMLRGDLERAAEISFECVMCGLCAARCPAEIAPYNAALFARRAYASLIRPRSRPLEERVAEIAAGKYDGEIAELTLLDKETLKQLHAKQDMEIP